ncbi:MAG TPA: DUF6438 domain-containing protein [Burkholderiales bacterium]|nr:DUF6438 domain-containing protein [Burkholderiales bacterium]
MHAARALLLSAALCLPALPAAPALAADEALPGDGPPREVLRYVVGYDGGPKRWSYEARLYSDANVIYTGRGLVKSRGRRRLHISEQQYDSLVNALEYADFMRMHNPKAKGNVTWSITYANGGLTKTLRGADAGPDWPRSLFQLIWSLESVLQTKDLACPINLTINKDAQEACEIRNTLMEKYYPRK